jgi:hypothetical protein
MGDIKFRFAVRVSAIGSAATVDGAQADPERQREEQGSDPISGGGKRIVALIWHRSEAVSKLPDPERARNLRPSIALGRALN